jgi:eukaryotic-like serine/threonine-protein kinase
MADLRSELAAALTGRYTIEGELGRGGMATVYLASDLRHDRPVALKVLHPELSASLGPERFQREIRLAARLQHPHILTVLDSGAAGQLGSGAERLWFTMPFVEGESLRDRLVREKQLPVEDALRIAREAADALDYAHSHGIIHRDIKPENILLSAGHALVADFGIARAVGGGEHLTETGMAIGTPAYMSPEQAAGERDLDARTDLYSLATVLYEMLTGEPPFTGPTAQAIIARRLTTEAPSVRQSRASVPEAADHAIRKSLAKVPADRFATAGEFGRALTAAQMPTIPTPTSTPVAPRPAAERPHRHRSVVLLGLGFLLGLGVLFGWLRRHNGEPTGDGSVKRLAVLPFENLGDSADGYFAGGVTDAIRGKLTGLPGLQVTASSSSSQYKGMSNKTPQQIGQELGVDYLVIGKVRWDKRGTGGSRVQVSPELIQVNTGAARWQQPFDAALTDVFQVQADIAGRVAQALDVALGAGEREKLAERPTQNLAAYDAYLKGEEVSQSIGVNDPATLRRAVGHYERAVAIDSGFAQAWAQLSRARSVIYTNAAPFPAQGAAARTAADKALALAPDRPEGYLALGAYYTVVGEFEPALEQFALGRKIDPRNADLLTAAAFVEQSLGRWDDVVKHLTEAQALDPRSVQTQRRLVRAQLWLRRYPEALAAAERASALAPTNLDILENKAMISLAQGDLAGARATLQSAPAEVDPTALVAFVALYNDLMWVLDEQQQALLLRLTPAPFDDNRAAWGLCLAQAYALKGNTAKTRAYADSALLAFEEQLKETPDDPQLHALRGLTLAYLGRRVEAVREGERSLELLPMSRDAFNASYNQHQLVRIYTLVGEPDKAIDKLEPLLKHPYFVSPGWLRIDPNFDPLRKHPRFQKLIAESR